METHVRRRGKQLEVFVKDIHTTPKIFAQENEEQEECTFVASNKIEEKSALFSESTSNKTLVNIILDSGTVNNS